MRTTLPIEGRMSYRYHDFALLFVRINPDAIALPSMTYPFEELAK